MRVVSYLRIDRRLYLLGFRVHHGTVGFVLALVGLWLVYHDRSDAREWVRLERLK